MESSRFIQISEDILVEYIYTDQTEPDVFNTSTHQIELIDNSYTDGSHFFNTIDVADDMGNYRDISAVPINENRSIYASLNTSIGIPYNDFDTGLTTVADSLKTFSPDYDIEYDRVKVHFIAGFNFDDGDGVIFDITAFKKNGEVVNLSSINFLRSDTPVFNPNPLLLGNKLYASYIEWKVPSLFYMNNRFDSNNDNLVSHKLTKGVGFIGTPSITITAKNIYQTRVENGFSYYDVKDINSTSILARDIYDNLYGQVVDSDAGDYFEISGEVSGSTLSNFIGTLNSQGGDYVVFHDVRINEQINDTFIETSSQAFTQQTDFDNKILFRPIILNSANAVSFSIDYTLRLFNKNDNTQIIKKARLVSFDVKKYGRRMMKINLGVVPTVAKVYNKLASDDGRRIVFGGKITREGQTSEQVGENLVVRTQYVTSFRDRLNVKAAISPARIQEITTSNKNDRQ